MEETMLVQCDRCRLQVGYDSTRKIYGATICEVCSDKINSIIKSERVEPVNCIVCDIVLTTKHKMIIEKEGPLHFCASCYERYIQTKVKTNTLGLTNEEMNKLREDITKEQYNNIRSSPGYVENVVQQAMKKIYAGPNPNMINSDVLKLDKFETGAIRAPVEFSFDDLYLPFFKEMAKVAYEGQQRYGKNNWRNGLPLTNLMNHAINHMLEAADLISRSSVDNPKASPMTPTGVSDAKYILAKVAWNCMAAYYELELEQLQVGSYKDVGPAK